MIFNPVLGAIAGDMIGVPYEFLRVPGVVISPDFPLWKEESHFSDDTVMTLAVAKWLHDGVITSNALIRCMQSLGRKYRNAGYGSSFGEWLDSDNPEPYGSFGNGSAMRVSPVGCLPFDIEDIADYAAITANVSHNCKEGVRGAQAIAMSIRIIQRQLFSKTNLKRVLKQYFPIYDLDRTPQQIIDSGYRFHVRCDLSVPEAICCFLDSNSYEETVRKAVLLRGDTDTQACMAGALAATRWGIPEPIAREAIERLPDDLYEILEDFSYKFNLDI